VARDPRGHLPVAGLGGRDEDDAPGELLRASQGERALPRAHAAQDQDGPGAHETMAQGLRLGEIA
jgi:hypothetical protein